MNGPCIIQFGTSRFLQAHVDLFAHEAAEAGQDVPPIVIVQTSGDPARAARVRAFGSDAGFPVIIRGIGPDGQAGEKTVTVGSVRQGLSVADDWAHIIDLFTHQALHVVSNTGDAGFRIAQVDRSGSILTGETRPVSFPAILLALLHHRWNAGQPGLTILPCELVRNNGATLREHILDLARDIGAPADFHGWLTGQCIWANTLVDRIVSEPIEPVGAVAEPYALWAVERQPGLVMPFTHPDVVLTDTLEPFERLKVHILNLGHSWLAEHWHRSGGDTDATVRQLLADDDLLQRLKRLYAEEVVPGFAAHGLESEARDYVESTLTRFANPYLDHRIADIFADHRVKIAKRIQAFIDWVDDVDAGQAMSQLRALARHHARDAESATRLETQA